MSNYTSPSAPTNPSATNSLGRTRSSPGQATAKASSIKGAGAAQEGTEQDSVDMLRSELERLSQVIGTIARQRTNQAAGLVNDGLDTTRDAIRQSPWSSIAIAGAGGAILAIATTSRSPSERSYLRHMQRSARRRFNSLHDVAMQAGPFVPPIPDVRSYISGSMPKASLADYAERLGNAISQLDPETAAGPLIDVARRVSEAISKNKA
jgi:ElaB/YqjD/DUF883 family membrane-anchored ribosome-binding protein